MACSQVTPFLGRPRASTSRWAPCCGDGTSTPFLTPDQIAEAVRQLAAWPLRIAQVRSPGSVARLWAWPAWFWGPPELRGGRRPRRPAGRGASDPVPLWTAAPGSDQARVWARARPWARCLRLAGLACAGPHARRAAQRRRCRRCRCSAATPLGEIARCRGSTGKEADSDGGSGPSGVDQPPGPAPKERGPRPAQVAARRASDVKHRIRIRWRLLPSAW